MPDIGYYLTNALGWRILSGWHMESNKEENAVGTHLQCIAGAFPHRLRAIICSNKSCKKMFKQTRHWQKFCSVSCRNADYWSKHERITRIIGEPNG